MLRLSRVVKCVAFYVPLNAVVITACSSVVYALFSFQNLLESDPQYVPGSSTMAAWNCIQAFVGVHALPHTNSSFLSQV